MNIKWERKSAKATDVCSLDQYKEAIRILLRSVTCSILYWMKILIGRQQGKSNKLESFALLNAMNLPRILGQEFS